MVDSLTQSDIDRIYERIQKTVDLKRVKNRNQLFSEINSNPNNKFWNRSLNNLFWDLISKKEIVDKQLELIVPSKPQYQEVVSSDKQRAYRRHRGRIWIESEIDYLIRLRKDGMTYKQIAEQIQRTKSSVSTKAVRLRKEGLL